jgi:hypothetical protein
LSRSDRCDVLEPCVDADFALSSNDLDEDGDESEDDDEDPRAEDATDAGTREGCDPSSPCWVLVISPTLG